jgi:peptidase M23-like protein
VQGWKRRAAVLLSGCVTLGAIVAPRVDVSAAVGDAWARDVRYCASTHANHGTWSGFGPAIDMNVPNDAGMPVYAPANGTVEVKTTGGAWGNSIHWVKAGDAEKIHFAHLKAVGRTGRVESGQVIGYVGATGRADSPHLHASAWRNGPAELVLSGVVVKADRCYTSAGPLRARAPVTRIVATSSRASRADWTRGSWKVELKCTDDWAGCAYTNYSLNGADPQRYTQPFTLNDARKHVVRFASKDRAGHTEPSRGPAVLGIDRTLPRVTLDEPKPPFGSTVEVIARASDPGTRSRPASSVYAVRFTACPADGGACRTFNGRRSGSSSTWVGKTSLPSGKHSVRARATDVAYNWAKSNAVAVTVP